MSKLFADLMDSSAPPLAASKRPPVLKEPPGVIPHVEESTSDIKSTERGIEGDTKSAAMVSRYHDLTPSRNYDAVKTSSTPIVDPVTQNQWIETIRKAVKQIGKESATHRFTVEEKQGLADLIYTYHVQGIRTSENEIARIGLNFLLQDYHVHGAMSILARVLARLNE